jgi:dihydrofolate synthase / folylpolyglutamate synthase
MTEQDSNGTPGKQVLVTGTAGRSSIATMIAAILHAGGASVLLATCAWPHEPSEAVRLNGAQLERDLLTALGFASLPRDAYAIARLAARVTEQVRPDWIVLGGLPPQSQSIAVAVLAPVLPTPGVGAAEAARTLLDHLPATDQLVCAPQRESVLDIVRPFAAQRGLKLSEVALDCRLARERSDLDGQQFRLRTEGNDYRLRMPLVGGFQLDNAATAVLAVEAALQAGPLGHELQPATPRIGLEAVRLPGRCEVIKRRPLVFVDAASNAASLRRLVEAIQPVVKRGTLQVILDTSAWSEIDEAVRLLAPLEPEIIAVGATSRRWADACDDAGLHCRTAPTVESAVETLAEGPTADPVLVTGSRAAAAASRAQVLALLPADLRLN